MNSYKLVFQVAKNYAYARKHTTDMHTYACQVIEGNVGTPQNDEFCILVD